MYQLTIELFTDGDFGYEDTEFNIEPGVRKNYYFEKRELAVAALKRHFESVTKSLRVHGMDYIQRWFSRWNDRIDVVSNNFKTFAFGEDFGNQSVYYGLVEVQKKELLNGSFSFDEHDLEADFEFYDEEDINLMQLFVDTVSENEIESQNLQ